MYCTIGKKERKKTLFLRNSPSKHSKRLRNLLKILITFFKSRGKEELNLKKD